jgi:hypothetical protein
MALLAINANVLFAVADVFGNGFAGIQLPPDLIEVADFNIGAQFDRAFIRFYLAEQNFQIKPIRSPRMILILKLSISCSLP